LPVPRVYACGPMHGRTFRECTKWRNCAQKLLAPEIILDSPVRQYRETEFDKHEDASRAERGLFYQDGTIYVKDRYAVYHADALLVNFLGVNVASIGSCIELGWADAWGKLVVVAMEPENVHQHPMVRRICNDIILPSVEEAAHALRKIILF
jgi:nucleoside 2-deoxyribosyltransferase